MNRIDSPTAVTALAAPTAVSGIVGFFSGGNPSTSTAPTTLSAEWLNMVQEELVAILAAASIVPSKADRGQVLAAIQALIAVASVPFASDAEGIAGTATAKALTPHSGAALVTARIDAIVNGAPAALDTLKELADAVNDDANFAATVLTALNARTTILGVQGGAYLFASDTGAANALVAALAPTPPALAAGMAVLIKVLNTNTGAAVLSLNGLGPASILYTGTPLAGGMLRSGQLYHLVHDGTNWQLLNPNLSGVASYADRTAAGSDGIVVPGWATHAEVQIVGAGGGGSGCSGGYAGAGGGAGGYSAGVVTVTPGATLTRVVGAGGAGGSASGSNGGDSSLTGVGTATGGQGGQSSTSAGGGGGAAANAGMRNFPGGYGGDGNARVVNTQGGAGAPGPFGGGGRTGSGGGLAGVAAGAGGGGAWLDDGPGGAGADGAVLIRFMS